MRITIEAESGSDEAVIASLSGERRNGATSIVLERVREFALLGLRVADGAVPQHFIYRSGTKEYLTGRVLVLARQMEREV